MIQNRLFGISLNFLKNCSSFGKIFTFILTILIYNCGTVLSDTEKKPDAPNQEDANLETVEPIPFFSLNEKTCQYDQKKQNSPNIQAYFSPSCAHCKDFFSKDLPTIHEKFLADGKIEFSFRPFCLNIYDFAIVRLSLCRGEKQFIPLFRLFLEHQDEWINFLVLPKKTTHAEKNKILDDMLKSYKLDKNTINTSLPENLKIGPDNEFSSILIFAIKNGFSADEIKKSLEGDEAEKMFNRLVVTTMVAVDRSGNAVPGIPAFYVDEKYYGVLSIKDFEKAANGEALKDPPGPTSTPIQPKDAPEPKQTLLHW